MQSRTEFFDTVTEGLLAEVMAEAERFDAGDPSVLRQIRYVLFECCECREEWKHLINVNLAASQLPLAREPRISAWLSVLFLF